MSLEKEVRLTKGIEFISILNDKRVLLEVAKNSPLWAAVRVDLGHSY